MADRSQPAPIVRPLPEPPATKGRGRRGTGRRARLQLVPQTPAIDWTALDPENLANPALYINRELSWLEFNQRVLAQAQDPSHPLLERVKFLAIAATNLDEFFMVRVATILKKHRAGIDDVSIDGLGTDEELEVTRPRAYTQMDEQSRCWREALRPQLAAEGIHFLEPDAYTAEITAWLTQ